jgi:protein involved in sex pheromone biosynthesis
MKKALSLAICALFALAACSKSAGDKIKEQISEKVHALTADERQLAETNAKQFFNREFPQQQADGSMGAARGVFLDCRPSDSNYNGLVTCHGVMPQVKGGFNDKAMRFCGYTPKLVGCSDEDTVK